MADTWHLIVRQAETENVTFVTSGRFQRLRRVVLATLYICYKKNWKIPCSGSLDDRSNVLQCEKYCGVPVLMTKQTTKESTKTQLLDAGIEIMLEKGYNNTGIMEVLHSTGVPKGSFYYYFDSKEDFGLQIINHFDATYQAKLSATLGDTTKTPIERLLSYCESTVGMLEQNACRKGCLIGNLSQEMADQSEVFRHRLREIMLDWRAKFADCIRQGQDAGEVSKEFDADSLAEFFQSGWSGAVMRSKTMKSTEPLHTFSKIFFTSVLKRS